MLLLQPLKKFTCLESCLRYKKHLTTDNRPDSVSQVDEMSAFTSQFKFYQRKYN